MVLFLGKINKTNPFVFSFTFSKACKCDFKVYNNSDGRLIYKKIVTVVQPTTTTTIQNFKTSIELTSGNAKYSTETKSSQISSQTFSSNLAIIACLEINSSLYLVTSQKMYTKKETETTIESLLNDSQKNGHFKEMEKSFVTNVFMSRFVLINFNTDSKMYCLSICVGYENCQMVSFDNQQCNLFSKTVSSSDIISLDGSNLYYKIN